MSDERPLLSWEEASELLNYPELQYMRRNQISIWDDIDIKKDEDFEVARETALCDWVEKTQEGKLEQAKETVAAIKQFTEQVENVEKHLTAYSDSHKRYRVFEKLNENDPNGDQYEWDRNHLEYLLVCAIMMRDWFCGDLNDGDFQ